MQQGYKVRKVLSKLRVVGTWSFFAPLVRRILRAHFRLVQNVPASSITFTVTTKHVYVDSTCRTYLVRTAVVEDLAQCPTPVSPRPRRPTYRLYIRKDYVAQVPRHNKNYCECDT